jgi:hypothetical protein
MKRQIQEFPTESVIEMVTQFRNENPHFAEIDLAYRHQDTLYLLEIKSTQIYFGLQNLDRWEENHRRWVDNITYKESIVKDLHREQRLTDPFFSGINTITSVIIKTEGYSEPERIIFTLNDFLSKISTMGNQIAFEEFIDEKSELSDRENFACSYVFVQNNTLHIGKWLGHAIASTRIQANEEAEISFQKCMELNPNEPNVRFNYACFCALTHRVHDAISLLRPIWKEEVWKNTFESDSDFDQYRDIIRGALQEATNRHTPVKNAKYKKKRR